MPRQCAPHQKGQAWRGQPGQGNPVTLRPHNPGGGNPGGANPQPWRGNRAGGGKPWRGNAGGGNPGDSALARAGCPCQGCPQILLGRPISAGSPRLRVRRRRRLPSAPLHPSAWRATCVQGHTWPLTRDLSGLSRFYDEL